jgi:DNA-binding transcriptional MerR regulator
MEDTTVSPDARRTGVPAPDDLLAIGQFSRLTGLTIGTLRHYDELGVLVPARVDPATGYRRYRRSQVGDGRTAALLRELELPLDEVREVLALDDGAARRALLARHRDRVSARVTRLHRVLHQLTHLVDPDADPQETPMTATATSLSELDTVTRRSLASGLFNRVWELLEQPDRTTADDEELVHAAHASRWFWIAEGTPKELAIGDWQIARVYSTLGRGEPAVHHARVCLGYAQQVPEQTWLLASAYEGLSRAYAVSGDRAAAQEWKDKALAQLELVEDHDDRDIVARDIDSLPV